MSHALDFDSGVYSVLAWVLCSTLGPGLGCSRLGYVPDSGSGVNVLHVLGIVFHSGLPELT